MCRTVRALPAAAVLASAALVISGPVASAHPGAGADRTTVRPGGTLTVPVPCGALTGRLPGSPGTADGQPCGGEPGPGQQLEPDQDQMLDPPEAALETGQAPQSAQVPPGQGQPPGPSQAPGAGQHTGQGQSSGQGQGQGQGSGQGQQSGQGQGHGQSQGQGQGQGQGQSQGQGQGQSQGQDEGGRQCAEGSRGCSGGSGGSGQCHEGQNCGGGDDSGQCRDGGGRCHGSGGECDDAHGASCPDGHACRESLDDDDCGPPAVQGGVQAGQGGTFTDSVPALAAGGALIAAACGGAGYRLFGRRPRARTRRVSG